MNRKLIVAVLALPAVISAYFSAPLAGLGERTHQRLTGIVYGDNLTSNLIGLQLSRSEYPDLFKFQRQILVDDGDQEDAHYAPGEDGVDRTIAYWYKNEGLWDQALRLNHYPTGNFVSAYTDLGYIIHLTQDSTVPAHDRVIFHGSPYTGPAYLYQQIYQLQPGAHFLDTAIYALPRTDEFENLAAGIDNSGIQTYALSLQEWLSRAAGGSSAGVNRVFDYNGATCSTSRKLWLCADEAHAGLVHDGACYEYGSWNWTSKWQWGVYSLKSWYWPGCGIPAVGEDGDWSLNTTYYPGFVNLVSRGMYLATRLTQETLDRYSKSLPPVVTAPTSEIDADFSSGSVSFYIDAQENRKPVVTLDVLDSGNGKYIRASVDGGARASLQGTAVTLPLTADTDLEHLPYATRLTITWDGTYADGSFASAGRHNLSVTVRDYDGHSEGTPLHLDVTPARFLLNAGVSPAGAGSLTSTPAPSSDGKYAWGTQVCLTPAAASGYSFSAWSGDLAGNTVPGCVTMNESKSVTATFTAIRPTLTSRVSPAGVGSLMSTPAPGSDGKYAWGTQVCLTPAAASGYSFSAWSDDLTGSTVPGCVTMNGSKSVTATFTAAVCELPLGEGTAVSVRAGQDTVGYPPNPALAAWFTPTLIPPRAGVIFAGNDKLRETNAAGMVPEDSCSPLLTYTPPPAVTGSTFSVDGGNRFTDEEGLWLSTINDLQAALKAKGLASCTRKAFQQMNILCGGEYRPYGGVTEIGITVYTNRVTIFRGRAGAAGARQTLVWPPR